MCMKDRPTDRPTHPTTDQPRPTNRRSGAYSLYSLYKQFLYNSLHMKTVRSSVSNVCLYVRYISPLVPVAPRSKCLFVCVLVHLYKYRFQYSS